MRMKNDLPLFPSNIYFSANSLSRTITGMAEAEFRVTGLSPSQAFVVMRVNEHPGIDLRELSNHLYLAPSTIARFVDMLARRGYLNRIPQGKAVLICATKKGEQLKAPIEQAWQRLYNRCCDILGEKAAAALIRQIDTSDRKLSDSS